MRGGSASAFTAFPLPFTIFNNVNTEGFGRYKLEPALYKVLNSHLALFTPLVSNMSSENTMADNWELFFMTIHSFSMYVFTNVR